MRSVLYAVSLFFLVASVPACSSSSAQSVPVVVGEATTGSHPYSLTKLGSGLVVFLSDTGTGWEPWVTDGTTAGTYQLAETASASANGGSFQAGVIFGSTGLPTFSVRGNEAYFCTYP